MFGVRHQDLAEREDAVFRALAHPRRRAIFERLTGGEAAVKELKARFDISQPAVSQHLATLRRAGLVSERREGRLVYYKVARRGLRPLVGWVAHHPAFWLRPIGVIRSTLKRRAEAPKQGREGAPEAWLEVSPFAAAGLEGFAAGDDVVVVTWLHLARRDVLKVHPRSDRRRPLTGVFATRSPDRPNPLGLHRVTVRKVAGRRLRIGPIEAVDGTPVVDIKPVLAGARDS